MGSPPKPWEATATASSTAPTLTSATASSNPASSTPPTVPERPAAFTSSVSSPYAYGSSPYSRLGTTMGGFGSYGGYGSFGSYPGMGYGMGGMYGGYGGGMGGYGMGYGGMPQLDAHGRPTLTQSLSTTTEHTFALLHSIVQTFSGVAQMLESTFMATHSSFFAMVGVVEQLGHLRNVLGSVLGLFGLVRWMRDLLTGNRSGPMHHEFREFINGKPVQGPLGPPAPRPSKKPLIIFLLAIVGVPYAMSKLVKVLNERTMREGAIDANGAPLTPLDPSQLTFARALYPFNASTPSELSLKQDEIVAIFAKLDPRTGAEVDPRTDVEGGEWWKGRTREGREGWFPRKWVQIIERQPKVKQVD